MMWEYEMAQTIKHTSVSSLELPRIKAFIAEYERIGREPMKAPPEDVRFDDQQ